jgi:hypothetical protein
MIPLFINQLSNALPNFIKKNRQHFNEVIKFYLYGNLLSILPVCKERNACCLLEKLADWHNRLAWPDLEKNGTSGTWILRNICISNKIEEHFGFFTRIYLRENFIRNNIYFLPFEFTCILRLRIVLHILLN